MSGKAKPIAVSMESPSPIGNGLSLVYSVSTAPPAHQKPGLAGLVSCAQTSVRPRQTPALGGPFHFTGELPRRLGVCLGGGADPRRVN